MQILYFVALCLFGLGALIITLRRMGYRIFITFEIVPVDCLPTIKPMDDDDHDEGGDDFSPTKPRTFSGVN